MEKESATGARIRRSPEQIKELLREQSRWDVGVLAEEFEFRRSEPKGLHVIEFLPQLLLVNESGEGDRSGSVGEGVGYLDVAEMPEGHLGHGELVEVDIEQRLLETVRDRLRVEASLDDDLGRLGVDSVRLAGFVADLEDAFEFRADQDIFEVETLRGLAAYIEQQGGR